jgi:maleylacetate reductase
LIVRWGLAELGPLLTELRVERPLLVATSRWSPDGLPVDVHDVFSEVPTDRVDRAVRAAAGADALLPLGGGSTIDLAKAISAETGLPVVSVPTTYAGAEWTAFFGIRDENRVMRGGGAGARLAGIVYEVELTLGLPRAESGGTALNALAHCAEALYVRGHNAEADQRALKGARLISAHLPPVLEDGRDRDAREGLLRGACEAGAALGSSGLALGHAMAQAVGGRYGLPHGAMNAICLPAALRFNEPVAGDAIQAFGQAMDTDGPIGRAEELARLAGFERLRDFGVPEDELDDVAAATVQRAGALANPRPASAQDVALLFRSVW